MADGQLGHVVGLLAQGDEVVVDARLVFARVVEVEILRLHVVRRELFLLESGYVRQQLLLFRRRHPPDDHRAVGEEEDFRRVHRRVEVGRRVGVVISCRTRVVSRGAVDPVAEAVGVVAV